MDSSQQPGEQITQTAEPLTRLYDDDLAILEQIKLVSSERQNGRNDNALPVVDVIIPQTVAIDCPLVRPMMRYANQCKKCKYYDGIAQTAWSKDEPIPWSSKYAIRCGFILERKTRQMVIE